MAGGLLAEATAYVRYSLLPPVCSYSAFCHPVLHQRKIPAGQQKRDAAMREVVTSLKNPKLVLSLFVTR